jgi:hypothetical protein
MTAASVSLLATLPAGPQPRTLARTRVPEVSWNR